MALTLFETAWAFKTSAQNSYLERLATRILQFELSNCILIAQWQKPKGGLNIKPSCLWSVMGSLYSYYCLLKACTVHSDGHSVVTYRWYSVRHQEDGCGHGRSLQAGSARCPDPRSRGRWMSVALRRQVTPGLALSPFTRYYHSLCKRELVSVCHKWSSADYHGVQYMCAVFLLASHAAMLGNKVWNI